QLYLTAFFYSNSNNLVDALLVTFTKAHKVATVTLSSHFNSPFSDR
uniref:Uncharacterized protein n=1 Tax=Ascaris lumbricoides TaxID=6252 RepID=A0A9J2Q9Z4_ASCLU